jgi:hypothetical protein
MRDSAMDKYIAELQIRYSQHISYRELKNVLKRYDEDFIKGLVDLTIANREVYISKRIDAILADRLPTYSPITFKASSLDLGELKRERVMGFTEIVRLLSLDIIDVTLELKTHYLPTKGGFIHDKRVLVECSILRKIVEYRLEKGF